jgi:hypothetical protein
MFIPFNTNSALPLNPTGKFPLQKKKKKKEESFKEGVWIPSYEYASFSFSF